MIVREKLQSGPPTRAILIAFTTLLVVLVTLSVTHRHYPILIPTPFLRASLPLPARGTISRLFTAQNLSHGHLHNDYTKRYLLDLVTTTPSQSVVIIGLAGGAEAVTLSRTHPVHAFEPMPHFVQRFRDRPKHTTANVTIYPVAAAESNDEIEVLYNGVRATVPARRPDGLLPQDTEPAVVSVDVQGAEFSAIKGLGHVIRQTASVWVEAGCKQGTDTPQAMLEYLDRDFVLFDYIPWGKRPGVEEMWKREQFYVDQGRPDGIREWVDWFCTAREGYKWLQTDFVGIRRSLLEGDKGVEIMRGLEEIGDRNCRSGCVLRAALAALEEE